MTRRAARGERRGLGGALAATLLVVGLVAAGARAEPEPPTASFAEPPSADASSVVPSPPPPPVPAAPSAAPPADAPPASGAAPPVTTAAPPPRAAAAGPAVAPAAAAPSAPPLAAPIAAGPAAAERGPLPLPESRFHDPHVDRGVIFPTAETQPRGTFVVTGYDFYLLRIGYAFTDWLQASVATIPPTYSSMRGLRAFGDASLKARLYRNPWVRVGTTLGYAGASDAFQEPRGYQHLRLGVMGTLCLEATCQIGFTPALHGFVTTQSDHDHFLVASFGLVVHTSRGFALLLEPSQFVWFSEGENDRGMLLSYGLRMHGERVAFDLTFARPLVEDPGALTPFGMPLLALTGRTRGVEARAAAARQRRSTPPRGRAPIGPPPGASSIPDGWMD